MCTQDNAMLTQYTGFDRKDPSLRLFTANITVFMTIEIGSSVTAIVADNRAKYLPGSTTWLSMAAALSSGRAAVRGKHTPTAVEMMRLTMLARSQAKKGISQAMVRSTRQALPDEGCLRVTQVQHATVEAASPGMTTPNSKNTKGHPRWYPAFGAACRQQ
jgi:hypothetical protein